MALGENIKSAKKTNPPADTAAGASWVDAASNTQSDTQEAEVVEQVVLAVFPIGREHYAIPIDVVKEVVKTPQIAPIPQGPEYVVGVANVRGNVLAMIDLRTKINPNDALTPEGQQYTIVIKHKTIQAGLLVNTVPDTLKVEVEKINTSAAVIKNLSVEDVFISGIVKADDGPMIILIDLFEMIQ
ncbi:chemotaxis protein CheW [Marinoscillum furvescens]|uniref:Purine-binding chemotaxis protein CheW n=1 Tax=Marinoscillum furvescens DSM 4134 TaxID=1122208 RepID=A0A3D9L6L9_MARFU|nr:chemotaxis protein CheW [Marinoscillum furvescens]REE00998.1 purine-binding chemotaxis protein CheW [Marinoscillum furvescens DSM 4134]